MKEEEYTEEIINLLERWKEESVELKVIHERLSNTNYKKHIIYGSIALIIPIILTFTSQVVLDQDLNRYISGSGFLVVGVTNAMLSFLNFKSKSLSHEFASLSHNTIIDSIDSNFSRQDKYKIPADVMIAQTKNEIKNLKLYGPRIANTCLSDICFNIVVKK